MRASAADLVRLRLGRLDLAIAKKRRLLTYEPQSHERIAEFERVFALDTPTAA